MFHASLFIQATTDNHNTVRKVKLDMSTSASKSYNKLTAVLSRSEYFSSVLKLSLHYVFSPVCLSVLNSIKPLKRGDES